MSVLCELIKSNPDWKEDLKKLNVNVTEDEHFWLLKYGIAADFTNQYVREARGIIIDKKTVKPVCWPFNKFCNHLEKGADDIDWSTAKVQQKVDGSILKLWFNPYTEKWQWSTNGVIDAENADVQGFNYTYGDLIRKAVNYKDIQVDNLNKNYTYIFELTSPFNKVVIDYPETSLWHIGTRDIVSEQELSVDIGIKKPAEYQLKSLDECLEAAKNLNSDDNVEYEGFVVVDDNWHRIKIKSPQYLYVHRLADRNNLSKHRILQMLRSGADFEKIVQDVPAYQVYFRYYQYKVAELEFIVNKYITYVRNLYAELNCERKAVAMTIKNDKLSNFGFRAIGNERTAKELLAEVIDSKYEDMIPEYEEPII